MRAVLRKLHQKRFKSFSRNSMLNKRVVWNDGPLHATHHLEVLRHGAFGKLRGTYRMQQILVKVLAPVSLLICDWEMIDDESQDRQYSSSELKPTWVALPGQKRPAL